MNAPDTFDDFAPITSTARGGFDPAETWFELAAWTGRILAAVHDAQQGGDTEAADAAIRAALPELRRVVDEIEGAYCGDDRQHEAREARLEAEGFRQWREREDAIADLIALRRQHQGLPPDWNPADADELTLAVDGDPFGTPPLIDPAAAFMDWRPPESGAGFAIEEPDAPDRELLAELAEHWPALGSEITIALDALGKGMAGLLMDAGPLAACGVRLSAYASFKRRQADVVLFMYESPGWPALVMWWTYHEPHDHPDRRQPDPTRLLRYESGPSGKPAEVELPAIATDTIAAGLQKLGVSAAGGGS